MQNKKIALIFQDNSEEGFYGFEDRLSVLLFSIDIIQKVHDLIYMEDEDGEPVYNFKTITEIIDLLNKNGIEYEEIGMEFFDYNNPE